MNITLPNWATKEVQKKMIPIVELEYEIQSYNMLMKRINGGHLVKEFIKNMDAKRNQTSPKIYVYSGHEVNIAAFVRAHNLIEPKIPKFGSAIIVEKLRGSTGEYFVQVRFIKLYKIKLFFRPVRINYIQNQRIVRIPVFLFLNKTLSTIHITFNIVNFVHSY